MKPHSITRVGEIEVPNQAFTTFLAVAFNSVAGSELQYQGWLSGAMLGAGTVAIRAVDSVAGVIGGASVGPVAALSFVTASFIIPRLAVPAGARIVELQLEVIGGPLRINPAFSEGASLVVNEILL